MLAKYVETYSSKALAIILLVICLGVYGTGYVMENYFDVQACALCHLERNVFLGAAAVAFIAILTPRHSRYWLIVFLGLIFLGGFGLALYHVGIQEHLISLPSYCSVNDLSAFDTIESLKEQLLQTPFVRCDQVTWSLFGLSLAVYNAIISFVLSALCWVWVWKQR